MARSTFLRLAAAGLFPVLWGVLVGWWTPRGPGTAVEALVSLGVSVAVGLAAGWLTRSRWALLVAPVLFVLAVELVRLPVRGAATRTRGV